MFIGHFAVGLAAKRVDPKTSLGTYFFACQFLDLLWPALVLMGIETVRVDWTATKVTPLEFIHYPYSHSLIMAIVWSITIGCGYVLLRKRQWKSGLLLGGVVFSHWILDWVSHGPDMPLAFDGIKTGLGLWNSVPGTIAVETGLFVFGLYCYVRTTRRPTTKASLAFWSLIGFLVAIDLLNMFGPKPLPGTPPGAIAAPALAMWLLVFWAHFADRRAKLL